MTEHHICFTAIPYNGFDSLMGTTARSATGSSGDRRKERLLLALKIGIMVGGVVAMGFAFGFVIAAIVRHAKHKHPHHRHEFQDGHSPVAFDDWDMHLLPQDHMEHLPYQHPSVRQQSAHVHKERPNRRHSQSKIVTGTTKEGFWSNKIRKHARPQTIDRSFWEDRLDEDDGVGHFGSPRAEESVN
jgi:hypothetical protein